MQTQAMSAAYPALQLPVFPLPTRRALSASIGDMSTESGAARSDTPLEALALLVTSHPFVRTSNSIALVRSALLCTMAVTPTLLRGRDFVRP
jgi:hypothetical protein